MNNDSPVNHVFILPQSFDPLALLPKSLHKFADDARYVASTVLRKTARGQADDHGYVTLKAKYLRKVISERRGRDVIESLLTAEGVHRKPYQVGVKSFSYRLDDRFRADPHIRRPIECRRLLRNLERHAAICRQEASQRIQPVHQTLAILQDAYRRAYRAHQVNSVTREAVAEFDKNAGELDVPPQLKLMATDMLKKTPTMSWDQAVADVAAKNMIKE